MAVGGCEGGRIGEESPSGSDLASPVSRAEIGECGCLGIGRC